jgi:anti-sigma regulatory factor (Ser/Thr protein kinase)
VSGQLGERVPLRPRPPVNVVNRAAGGPVGEVLGILTFVGRQEDVAQARGFVAYTLRDHPQQETAVLLASELVTNGVVHGAGNVTVMVLRTTDAVRVEVTDSGTAGRPRVRPRDADAENGRGLLLVDCLAARWGHARAETGLTTWFELDGHG